MDRVKEIKHNGQTNKQQTHKGRETSVSVPGRWEEHNDQSCMTRGYLFSFSQNHLENHTVVKLLVNNNNYYYH